MNLEKNKERDAIIRMMLYLKHELIRNNFIEESKDIDAALEKISARFSIEIKEIF